MRLRAMVFGAAALLALGGPALAAEPGGLVGAFHESLLDVMKKAATTRPAERYQQLVVPVDSAFNMPFMIQIAAGTKWRTANDDEKAKLTDAFKRMSAATYAARFDGFSGERFETIGEQDGPSGTRLVLTQILRPGKDSVPLTYVVRKFGNDWRIIDVIVEGGISELAVRRSEYTGVLNDAGVAGLVKTLNQTADRLLAK